MSERIISVPIKYVGEAGDAVLTDPYSSELAPIQAISAEALSTNSFYNRLSEGRQRVVLQSLSVLGSYAISICEGNWNSFRWADVWSRLNIDASGLVSAGTDASSEPIMRRGFETLFHMLETGTETVEELKKLQQQNCNKRETGLPFSIGISQRLAMHAAIRANYYRRNRK